MTSTINALAPPFQLNAPKTAPVATYERSITPPSPSGPPTVSAPKSTQSTVDQQEQNTQLFLSIFSLLSQVGKCIKENREPTQATALLQQSLSLLSTLSTTILVPDISTTTTTVKVVSPAKSTFNLHDDDDQAPFDDGNFVHLTRSLSRGASTHSAHNSPPQTHRTTFSVSAGASPARSLSATPNRVIVPGTPNRRLQPPTELLTPPSSLQKPATTWTAPDLSAFAALNFDARRSQKASEGSDRSSIPSPSTSPVQGVSRSGLPAGFQSTSDPRTSDADFQRRAHHHRVQGRGAAELYEATLQMTGATTIDGMTCQFKITDAYFNHETFNYSESLARTDGSGITGYRYSNRNGSQYIRFDESTGPRICFTRHAHPPFNMNTSVPPQSYHSSSPMVPPFVVTPQLKRASMHRPVNMTTRHASFGGGDVLWGASPEGRFSVQEFWK